MAINELRWDSLTFNNQGLAWTTEAGDRQRLGRIVALVLPVFLAATLYISWITLPEPTREKLETLPPQLAQVILKKKEVPPPVQKREEKQPEPVEKVAEQPKPEAKKLEQPIAQEPKVKLEPTPKVLELAREKARNSGLLAMTSQLAALKALTDNVKLDAPTLSSSTKPIARKATDGLAATATAVRSSGLDQAHLKQEAQSLSLVARAATAIQQTAELDAALKIEQAASAKTLTASRSSEDIRRVIDANKAAINSLYNRALREKPSLQGVVTPLLVVETNGSVSSCEMDESTLNEPTLESKICKRLLMVNFGPKPGVAQMKVRVSIDLLPG